MPLMDKYGLLLTFRLPLGQEIDTLVIAVLVQVEVVVTSYVMNIATA
jgi:hypothetical protein